ncbi:aromatic ring-hydroxylating oxygenase subunit alpha [[Mycobacterium] burgundiense]|uniref:Aromatic ring-hydroxylating dioxygenase subunit alpha n=1 Tax=[Mycobacterium] burgundiense TaxID=3064286 RepID=A0ABN9NTH6_9MYCO|nr:aromatic ring-hydroxylating dioxygenase subunit alpha [Mycolicibacterium sp. MU0053]CAJ1511080.1 aromatic ring-hydroxylating dioxygenase subunit alpha [Mycolicibacterium sp. MU0053]
MTIESAPETGDLAELTRRVLTLRHIEHVQAGTTDLHPDGARVVPAGEYLDPEVASAERALMHAVPIVAALSGELPGPRTFRTELLFDVPVMLVRQNDGSVKAFLNSCSHRGAKLLEGSGEIKKRISCSYHAWTYSPAGELLSVTQPGKFGDIDFCDYGLVELPCAERHGFIFVVLDPKVEMDIDAFLGDFAAQLAMCDLDAFAVEELQLLPHDVNWKVALCGYLESYHVKTVHARTLAPSFIGNGSTHDAFGPQGRHIRTTWSMNVVKEMAAAPDVEAVLDSLTSAPYNTVLYLWPNTIITAPDFADIRFITRLFPGRRPDTQLTDNRIMLKANMTDEERAAIGPFYELASVALEEEDYAQVPGINAAIQSGLRDSLLIGANEPSVTEAHRNMARALGRPQPDQPAPTAQRSVR